MSICAQDFLDVAAALDAVGDEPSIRSSISRSYYAAYHCCMAWHSGLPMPGKYGAQGGMHQKFVDQLRHPATVCSPEQMKKSKLLGMRLDILRNRRKVADYDLSSTLTLSESANQRQIATQIASDCAQH